MQFSRTCDRSGYEKKATFFLCLFSFLVYREKIKKRRQDVTIENFKVLTTARFDKQNKNASLFTKTTE